jgi:uncharacterized protein YgbK (DUF1537 family)
VTETLGSRGEAEPILLGCIADDFTGATDLASMLADRGMRTIQLIGLPEGGQRLRDVDAAVVALKSRAAPAAWAVEQSCRALEWLLGAGARQIFFKYCSTFDSTDQGNIGPVACALLERIGESFTIACPAFPANGRTVYRGHLFVGDALLSESGMERHPLNPMTDSNLVRVLGRQVKEAVDLVPYETVERGSEAISWRFAALRDERVRYAIVDALCDRHLLAIGAACADLRLVTGGSGVAMGLPDNFRARGLLSTGAQAPSLGRAGGFAAVLAGSCSSATLQQVSYMQETGAAGFAIDPLRILREDVAEAALGWALPRLSEAPVMIYASAGAAQVARVQERLGRERAGYMIEQVMAQIARRLVEAGVRRMLVAGGETAGAVVQALGVRALRIGASIDPGVPWTKSLGEPAVFLALKSGNFGSVDFFVKAFRMLQ